MSALVPEFVIALWRWQYGLEHGAAPLTVGGATALGPGTDRAFETHGTCETCEMCEMCETCEMYEMFKLRIRFQDTRY